MQKSMGRCRKSVGTGGFALVVFISVLLACCGWASAAGADPVPASTPAISTAPAPAQASPSAAPAADTKSQPAVEESPQPATKFQVKSFQVSGNTAVTSQDIDLIVKGYLGRELTLEDLKQAAQDIQKAYQAKGYFLAKVYIPAQTLKDGVVRFEVLEGKLGEVRVEGNTEYRTDFILKRFAGVGKDGILSYDLMQRSLLLLNEFSDMKVQSVLQPGKDMGTTDVVLKVEDKKPFHIGMDYNNFGNSYVGDNRAGLGLSYGNMAYQGDLLNVRGVFPFPSKSSSPFLQGAYTLPVGLKGARAGLMYANSQMTVGRDLEVLDIRGEASIYGLTYSIPLTRTILAGSDFSVGFVSKTIRNYMLQQTTSKDDLRELVLGYSYNGIYGRGRNLVSLNLTQGLGEMLGGMKDNDPQASRPKSGDSFTKLNVDLARIQQLGSRNFLILRASGQFTTAALVVGELYALGGYDSVRGYAQSEYMGDNGYLLSAEFRLPLSKSQQNPIQGALFVDYGSVSDKNPQPGVQGSRSLLGAGPGIRFSMGENTALRVDYGIPLDPNKNSQGNSSQVYCQFSTRF
ncbi:MAG: ShlB/FhaC/HecB family hemolysin secretion/activation protein [bacterium]